MKQNTNWFRHDATASDDAKMLELFDKLGVAGIGCYWMIVEALYKNEGYMSDAAIQAYAKRNTFVSGFFSECKKIELLQEKRGEWFSQRLLDELRNKEEKSKKARGAIMARWQKDAKKKKIRTKNGRNTDVILGEERRGEERRASSTKKANANVQKIIDTLKQHGNLDETDAVNRRYAYLLLKKAMKNKIGSSEKDAADGCAALINAIKLDDFWGGKVTSTKYLYYNAEKLANEVRTNQKTLKKQAVAFIS